MPNKPRLAEKDAGCNCFEYGGRSMCPAHSPEPNACCCDLLTARLLICPAHPTRDIPHGGGDAE